MSNIEELEGSELGTIEYWEKSYERELKNYSTSGDPGEIWFEEDSQERVINWMEKNEKLKINKEDSFIDIGTGNGQMLIELAQYGYTNLTGVDYSPKAIELAKRISSDKKIPITYLHCDMISQTDVHSLGKFKIVHDKGTYDAISLMQDNVKEKRNKYLKNVHSLVHDEDGILIITTCNWTEEEIVESFKDLFVLLSVIPTPTFKFGGKVGNVVTCLVFSKKK